MPFKILGELSPTPWICQQGFKTYNIPVLGSRSAALTWMSKSRLSSVTCWLFFILLFFSTQGEGPTPLKISVGKKKNLFRKTAQYFLDTTYQRSRYNSIMVQDIEKMLHNIKVANFDL